MGHRLSKIYTKTGDKGITSLADGSRIDKDHGRISTLGDVDELNSLLGLLIANNLDAKIRDHLIDIQHILFDMGGELAIPNSQILDNSHAEYLEKTLDEYNSTLSPLKEFILPGGSEAAAMCHYARSVCRRAERQLVSLSREPDSINQASLQFLNRLSDLLFVLARVLTHNSGSDEVYWQSNRLKDNS